MRHLIFLALTASLSLAVTANSSEEPWYLGIEGGVELSGRHDGGTLPSAGEQLGPAVFGTLGREIDDNLRIEGEVGYRSSEQELGTMVDFTQLSAMVNLLYEAQISDDISLLVGGGAGVDYVEAEVWWTRDDDIQGAVQLKMGLDFAIADATDLTVAYRYMTTFSNGIVDLDNSTVTIGLRFQM